MKITNRKQLQDLPLHIRSQIPDDILPSERHSKSGDMLKPQRALYHKVLDVYPDARWNYRPIPHRKLELDIALPEYKIGIEVDGWQFHGKHLSSHFKDREKQNLLVIHGWAILRFTMKHLQDLDTCVHTIQQAVRMRENTHASH